MNVECAGKTEMCENACHTRAP